MSNWTERLMDTEENGAMNGDNSREGIRSEREHLLPQESGKYRTSTKEGGKTTGKEGI